MLWLKYLNKCTKPAKQGETLCSPYQSQWSPPLKRCRFAKGRRHFLWSLKLLSSFAHTGNGMTIWANVQGGNGTIPTTIRVRDSWKPALYIVQYFLTLFSQQLNIWLNRFHKLLTNIFQNANSDWMCVCFLPKCYISLIENRNVINMEITKIV